MVSTHSRAALNRLGRRRVCAGRQHPAPLPPPSRERPETNSSGSLAFSATLFGYPTRLASNSIETVWTSSFGSQDAYDRLGAECTAALAQARDRFRQLRAHPVIDVDRELAALDRFVTDFEGRMREYKAIHPTRAISEALDRLTDLFEGRVGEKWQPEKLNALKKEARSGTRTRSRRATWTPGSTTDSTESTAT